MSDHPSVFNNWRFSESVTRALESAKADFRYVLKVLPTIQSGFDEHDRVSKANLLSTYESLKELRSTIKKLEKLRKQLEKDAISELKRVANGRKTDRKK